MGSSTVHAPASASVQASTIAEAFRLTVDRYGDTPAVRTKDDEISLTWSQLRDRVDALAGGLAKVGVRRGDTVALMLSNRPEFHIADLAAMTLGAIPFSIYSTSSPEQIAYVVSDAEARVAIVEVRLAEDGELLVRSDAVMTGYRNAPDKTAEALDADGWLHTGDIATIDEDGYVTLVDRKKELIISSAGKNMSPANIESELKGASPVIGQACCIGDARPYNTAIIVLDTDFAPAWAAKHGLEGVPFERLGDEATMRAAVQDGVDAANGRLARAEQIKEFVIVRGDWSPGGDELTPTMKLKRKPIGEKYASDIEAMYAS